MELVHARRRGAEAALVRTAARAQLRADRAEDESARLRDVLGRARRVLAEAMPS
jgi:hypothetical protein